ncbi:purine-binding chemotaxis protein CheW [Candidatus Poribacteria bacterium]|nr:purine-binding chemotaxis protein CheW [Candidatus Poribacteria bacterium]
MKNTENKEVQIVTFMIRGNYYAIDISQVEEVILPPTDITRIPDVPDYMEGVMDFRNKIVPLVNLAKRFNMGKILSPDTQKNNKNNFQINTSRVLLVTVNKKIIGLIVDAVLEVVKFNMSELRNASDVLTGVQMEFFFGVGHVNKNLVLMLALDKIFPEEFIKPI